jgi:uncharacterized phage protein gp47/JayE/uncharacterized protein YmfQ (DUF2313 family)
MSFSDESLQSALDRVYANYVSLFRPLDKTPRQSLLKVFATVDAGIYHQLRGDLDFLSAQIFPDTACGENLREHWSSRVTPLYASGAAGEVLVTGTPGKTIPAGLVLQAASGEKYYTEKSYAIAGGGGVIVHVKSEGSGLITNLAAENELTIVSALAQGIDSTAKTTGGGISGGADSETDEEYLERVLLALRNPARYGKTGDFAAWALDSSVEVQAAWEFVNFGVFGALLIQVINGNQFDGVSAVGNIAQVVSYINEVAPPILFTVRSPKVARVNPSITLLAQEDTQTNPRGEYWDAQFSDPASDAALFAKAKSVELVRFRQRMAALLDESKPETTTALIAGWERVLLGETFPSFDIQRRRLQLSSKNKARLNRAEIERTAARFGLSIKDVSIPYRPGFFGCAKFAWDRLGGFAAFSIVCVSSQVADVQTRHWPEIKADLEKRRFARTRFAHDRLAYFPQHKTRDLVYRAIRRGCFGYGKFAHNRLVPFPLEQARALAVERLRDGRFTRVSFGQRRLVFFSRRTAVLMTRW